MRAVIITRPGGPEVLEVRDVAAPQPGPDEILVRVRASALNRADLLQREGKYPAPPGFPQDIPGMEFAGEVAAVGSRARQWRKGQRVFGLIGGGANAEYVAVHERTVAEIPKNLSWTQAAAVPEAFITAEDALWLQADLRPGERVLIHAVGSGVGLAAVQLSRAMGAEPYGTSRTADKLQRAVEFGLAAGVVVGTSLAEIAESAHEWTGGRGFNVVLDLVGGNYVRASIEALGLKGRLMLVGSMGGGQVEFALHQVMSKRLRIMGTVLRARPLEEKIAVTQAFASQVVPLLARGMVRPVVDTEFPLDQVREAHTRLASNETFGKVVLLLS
jgi:NADPH2:quinone reductase